MALSMACIRALRRAAVLRCKIGVWLILSRSRHRRRNWVVASPTSSPRSDDSKALVWFLRRTLRQRFSAVRRTVWRTRFLVDSLFGNAITSSDQWTASFGEASQVLSPKSRSLARGNRKKRCDHAAGASGAGPAEAVASSPLTPPRIVWRASESSATPKLAFAACTAARASLGVSPESRRAARMRSWAAQPSCASTSSASASQTRKAVGSTDSRSAVNRSQAACRILDEPEAINS